MGMVTLANADNLFSNQSNGRRICADIDENFIFYNTGGLQIRL